MKARVFITLKDGVLDPEGKAIGHALHSLGFSEVCAVRQGKIIDMEIEGGDTAAARARVKEMCEKLLANTVMEKYEVDFR